VPTTYRLGVIGFAHMHVNSLIDDFNGLPNVEWAACADTVPAEPSRSDAGGTRTSCLRRAQQVTGIPRTYDDYREMLARERFDIVIACPENARHGEVTEAIAAAGAHVVTEKPMAARFEEALRMARACERHGVTLMVNWPTTWSAGMRRAKELVEAGEIGELFQFKWRAGSQGPLKNLSESDRGAEWWHHRADGGGALLDYCCYGACLSRWFLGEPAVAVTGMTANLRSPYGDADDNAVLIARFPQAMAILEATWSTVDHGIPTGPILYGTTGTLVVERQPRIIRERGAEGTRYEPEPLPEARNNLAKELIHHLETGEPLHPTLQAGFNLDAQAILDAGIRSAATGQVELAPTRAWPAG
jgi:predicted dehydrogenase